MAYIIGFSNWLGQPLSPFRATTFHFGGNHFPLWGQLLSTFCNFAAVVRKFGAPVKWLFMRVSGSVRGFTVTLLSGQPLSLFYLWPPSCAACASGSVRLLLWPSRRPLPSFPSLLLSVLPNFLRGRPVLRVLSG